MGCGILLQPIFFYPFFEDFLGLDCTLFDVNGLGRLNNRMTGPTFLALKMRTVALSFATFINSTFVNGSRYLVGFIRRNALPSVRRLPRYWRLYAIAVGRLRVAVAQFYAVQLYPIRLCHWICSD